MTVRASRQTRSGDEIIQLAVRLGCLAFLLYWSFVLVRPFIALLVWGMVLTVALYQPYQWLAVHLGGRPKLAAVIVTAINLAIVIGPVTWLGISLVDGLQGFAGRLGAGTLAIPSPPEGVKDWPIVGGQIYNSGIMLRRIWRQPWANSPHSSSRWPVRCSALPAVRASERSSSCCRSCFPVSCSIYGPRSVAAIRRIQARLVTQGSEDFVALAGLTIRTVSQGVIGVAILQSLLAGIGLKLAGVPHCGRAGFRRVDCLQFCRSGRRSSCFPSSYGSGSPRISRWRSR